MMKTIIPVLVVLAAVAVTAGAQESGMKAEKIVFCLGIEEKQPVGENTQFFERAEKIYCYTRITGGTDSSAVWHKWYFGDEEKASVRLPVRSTSWRTWSSKKMIDAWVGAWRVDVVDEGGEVIGSREFIYKPVEQKAE
jgi:hypothetical protein